MERLYFGEDSRDFYVLIDCDHLKDLFHSLYNVGRPANFSLSTLRLEVVRIAHLKVTHRIRYRVRLR